MERNIMNFVIGCYLSFYQQTQRCQWGRRLFVLSDAWHGWICCFIGHQLFAWLYAPPVFRRRFYKNEDIDKDNGQFNRGENHTLLYA